MALITQLEEKYIVGSYDKWAKEVSAYSGICEADIIDAEIARLMAHNATRNGMLGDIGKAKDAVANNWYRLTKNQVGLLKYFGAVNGRAISFEYLPTETSGNTTVVYLHGTRAEDAMTSPTYWSNISLEWYALNNSRKTIDDAFVETYKDESIV